MAATLAKGVTIAANQSLNSLGPLLSQLMDGATLSGVSDDEAGDTISILRTQASAPTSVDNDVWQDTTTKTLRVYNGPTSFKRWEIPYPAGPALINALGVTSTLNSVVAFSNNYIRLSYDDDAANPSGGLAGVVGEAVANTAWGLLRMRGVMDVQVTGTITRGDILIADTSAPSFRVISGGTTTPQVGGLGWALEANASGDATIKALIHPWNI